MRGTIQIFLALAVVLTTLIDATKSSTRQGNIPCKALTKYENRNQVDYGPLSVRKLSGIVIDRDGATIPNACLSLFTEKEHRLIASVVADEDGRYDFGQVSTGKYRLIARDNQNAFCVANAQVQIVNWPRGKKRIVVHLRASGYDTCSFADYK